MKNYSSINNYDYEAHSIVAKELKDSVVDDGLWVKSFAESNGDQNKTRAIYIKYRAKSISNKLKENAAEEKKSKIMFKERLENLKKRKIDAEESLAKMERSYKQARPEYFKAKEKRDEPKRRLDAANKKSEAGDILKYFESIFLGLKTSSADNSFNRLDYTCGYYKKHASMVRQTLIDINSEIEDIESKLN